MAVRFDPPDLTEKAAEKEGWDDRDRQHAERIIPDAFEQSFEVKLIQQTGIGLIAYDAPFASFESVRFEEHAEKPVLTAVEDLSRRLLNVKEGRT